MTWKRLHFFEIEDLVILVVPIQNALLQLVKADIKFLRMVESISSPNKRPSETPQ